MAKYTRSPDLGPLVRNMLPYLNMLFALYSNSDKRFRFPAETMRKIRIADFPNWSQFYQHGGPVDFLNFILKIIGIDANAFSESSPDSIPQLVNVMQKISTEKFEDQKISNDLEKNESEIILRYIAFVNDAICLMHNKASITELLPRAQRGERDAFFKILRVDKSVIGSDWALKRIREAQLSGDNQFFAGLGRAMGAKTGPGRLKHLRLTVLLSMLWNEGLSAMKASAIFDLIEGEGLYGRQFGIDDVQSLTQFLNRIGLKKFKRKKRPS